MQAHHVGKCLTAFIVIEAIHFFEVGSGNFCGVFTDFNFRNDGAILIFDGCQLVDTAKYRVTLGSDHPLAYTKGVQLGTLHQQIADQVLVQCVRGDDLTLSQAGFIQHFASLAGEIGQIAGVNADAAFCDPFGQKHFLEYLDGVWNTGAQYVVGIHQQRSVIRIEFAIGLECSVLIREHLYPGVCHGAGGGHAIVPVSLHTGSSGTSGNIGGAGTENCARGALSPTGAKLSYRAALRGPDDAAGFGGDQRLMVQLHQHIGLNKLCLNSGGTYRQNRLAGEDRGSLRNSPNIACKFESTQILQKLLSEAVFGAQISNVFLGEVQITNIFDHLLQTGCNGKAAAVRDTAEENIKVGDAILQRSLKIAVGHGELVKVEQHGVVGPMCHV